MRAKPLLSQGDPDPVLVREGGRDWLLTVEHAGRAVPGTLGDLGLKRGEIDRHIGWDPGALDLAQALAARADATLVAQRYSRLVIDCNRPWASDDLVPARSDRTAVPGNTVTEPERKARWDEIHAPFHQEVALRLDKGARRIVAVHSYDPRRDVDGATRPWPIGLLARVANPLMAAMQRHLEAVDWVAPLGLNEPYEIEDASDYTIPVHAEPRALPHVLVEVRNDYLRDARAVAKVADTLHAAFMMQETS